MNEFKIFLSKDSKDIEIEVISDGYRNDVIVNISNKFYRINVYDIKRLKQNFEKAFGYSEYYPIEPNLVLVNEVSKEQIYLTIKELYKQGFFDKLKPLAEIKVI